VFNSSFDQLLNSLHPGGREGRMEARCKELERRNAELLDYFHQKRRTTCSNHAAFITRNTSH